MAIGELRNLLENPNHHAFLIIGDRDAHYNELRLFLREKVSAGKLESADIWPRSYETIGIDDAREIKEIQNTKPNGERRVILISLSSIQSEAQNSLLKLFEEPTSDTIFIICAKSPEIFLPTLLSRFYIIEPRKKQKSADFASLMPKFLSGTIQERLTLLEPIIKEKDKNLAESFLDNLEFALFYGDTATAKGEILPAVFEDIFSARRFLRGRAPSVKMILEHICCIIPVIQGVKNKQRE